MKRILVTLFSIGVLFSCSNDDDSNSNIPLIGDWKLIEILADPGDGSGTFSSVESEKIITFEKDGTITSNGMLCNMSINTDQMTSGTYSVSELAFNSSDCINSDYNYTFKQDENILIVSYPCIELCQAKFIKE